jgi:hypothetical protein
MNCVVIVWFLAFIFMTISCFSAQSAVAAADLYCQRYVENIVLSCPCELTGLWVFAEPLEQIFCGQMTGIHWLRRGRSRCSPLDGIIYLAVEPSDKCCVRVSLRVSDLSQMCSLCS